MQIASGMRAGAGSDSRGLTGACIPEPGDGMMVPPLRRLAVLT